MERIGNVTGYQPKAGGDKPPLPRGEYEGLRFVHLRCYSLHCAEPHSFLIGYERTDSGSIKPMAMADAIRFANEVQAKVASMEGKPGTLTLEREGGALSIRAHLYSAIDVVLTTRS